MENITGKLTNWSFDKKHNIIVGRIEHDNRGRFHDMTRIYTSNIKEFVEDGRYAITLNSIYELDPPFVEKE